MQDSPTGNVLKHICNILLHCTLNTDYYLLLPVLSMFHFKSKPRPFSASGFLWNTLNVWKYSWSTETAFSRLVIWIREITPFSVNKQTQLPHLLCQSISKSLQIGSQWSDLISPYRDFHIYLDLNRRILFFKLRCWPLSDWERWLLNRLSLMRCCCSFIQVTLCLVCFKLLRSIVAQDQAWSCSFTWRAYLILFMFRLET